MEKEQKKTQFINNEYIIHELIDETKAVNENLKHVSMQQFVIKDCISKDTKALAELPQFVEQLQKQIDDLKEKIRINDYRIECFEKILDVIHASKTDYEVYAISMLLEALGIVNKEAKSVEERLSTIQEVK